MAADNFTWVNDNGRFVACKSMTQIRHLHLSIAADFGSRLLESQVASEIEVAVEDLACTIFKYYNRSSPLIQEVDDNLGRLWAQLSAFLSTQITCTTPGFKQSANPSPPSNPVLIA
jgi:hypothetical protein